MKKILLILIFTIIQIHAIDANKIIGNWNTITKTQDNGLVTIEKEYLNISPNNNFNIVLLVSVQKDQAYIKDLRIEAYGTWDVRDNTLVLVVSRVNVPQVQDIQQISQESLNNLAANFKAKYENNPIHILKVKFLNNSSLTIINEKYREVSYSR